MTSSVTVVKCGGGPSLDLEAICRDVAALTRADQPVVLVHGGSGELDRLADRLGVPQRRMTTPSGSSSRYTDPATLEVLLMALVGKVKPGLVAGLARHGASAVGLTGMDHRLLVARRTATHRAVLDGRTVLIRDDHNGRIQSVDPTIVRLLVDAGITPVISPPALGEDGGPVNVDADRAAAAVAAALATPTCRTTLILLTAAPGVLADPGDESSLRSEVALAATGPVLPEAVGGMTVKLQAARDALRGGVTRVLVADGRRPAPVTDALAGAGTSITTELVGSHR
ncbi:[LysW]-aminoadipate kinase [Actinoplanes sp. NEAU-A12]|uniref:[LysW]-aminoadipate kinase n=1 Tax=Actinoplanes sandaracinus TaxID=3045177 RepID=A0ABT6WTC6_9ACTN|nr:[LysW]-aminoadipate kinase [Actinoplanes sandaracinus]MDI6102999.1 [LysW]-aminoadipate kinase [Actinoplanes sandaracinus]